jgi:hypothetical protein
MTSQPEKTVGPWDMKKLLDLLNASEVLGAPEDAPADLLDEHEPRDAAPVPSLESVFVAENQLLSDHADQEPMRDEVENRFAAHIVHAMSKLTRE